jgi:glutathione S-transferase
MAARIALYEAGAAPSFIEVDPKTKQTGDGADYRAIYSLGLVPALRTDTGELLTENAAILQYVAAQFPEAGLAPAGGLAQFQLQQWLCFIGTELHKGLFVTLLDRTAPPEAKSYSVAKGKSRLEFLADHLADREYLLDRFSVADAYLATVLNWSRAIPVALLDLQSWPALAGYLARMQQRPSVARALQEEYLLYTAELARHKSA